MLIPLFLLFGIGLVAANGRGSRASGDAPRSSGPPSIHPSIPPLPPGGRAVAAVSGRGRGCTSRVEAFPLQRGRSAIDDLDDAVRNGHVPSPRLVEAAIEDALAVGRHDVAQAISRAFSSLGDARDWRPTEMAVEPGDPPEDRQPIVDALEPTGDEIDGAPAITVSGLSSPFPWVSNQEWASFSESLSRELPTYTAKQHVGMYRQRRERLDEIGIDPSSIVDSPDAQADALARDMSDAYDQMQQNGILDQCVGTTIRVPTHDAGVIEVQVTRSGVLGVVNAAGIENARSWLTCEQDRTQFPHTTDIFLRTNGMF